jgi:hypothetical protein
MTKYTLLLLYAVFKEKFSYKKAGFRKVKPDPTRPGDPVKKKKKKPDP